MSRRVAPFPVCELLCSAILLASVDRAPSPPARVHVIRDPRNGPRWDGGKISLHYSNPKVCRCFLLGLCPHNTLAGTKMAMGACSKIHNYALKADFEKSSRMYRPGQHRFYDLKVRSCLQKVIRSCKILDRAKKGRLTRCQSTAGSNHHGDKEGTLKYYGDMMDKKLIEVEQLGNKEKVQEALAVTKEVELLKRRRNRPVRMLDRNSNELAKEQKQNICDDCQPCIGLDYNEQRASPTTRAVGCTMPHSTCAERSSSSLRSSTSRRCRATSCASKPRSSSRSSRCRGSTRTRAHSYSPRSGRGLAAAAAVAEVAAAGGPTAPTPAAAAGFGRLRGDPAL
ncbi:putative RNA-binding protein Luc7-like 2 [Dermacentor silvarum]|uniref:putative RNA-binding protein Luc7-like 2 n=1 Tax=Dermacentor silvarum TaxID=543639 RepID=UPI0021012FD3|nr:putative RNA-binding protein Luc7-like 2 [Dermacentor silvarum]